MTVEQKIIWIVENRLIVSKVLLGELRWELIDIFIGQNKEFFNAINSIFWRAMDMVNYSCWPSFFLVIPLFFSVLLGSFAGLLKTRSLTEPNELDFQMVNHLSETLFGLGNLSHWTTFFVSYHQFFYKNIAFDLEFSALVTEYIVQSLLKNTTSPEFVDYIYNLMQAVN